MRNLKAYLLLVVMILLASCRRDHLYYASSDTATLLVEPDWTSSGVRPNGVTVFAFNESDGSLYKRFPPVGADQKCYIKLPEGDFTLVVMNDTPEEFDGQIEFTGEDNNFYGKHHTESTKEKISEICKERLKDKTNHPMYGKYGEDNPNYGKKRSEESKERMREARKSIEITDEQRQYLSERVSGENNPMYGVTGTKHPRARKIAQYDLDNNFIRYWDYIRQAARELNIGESNITACCRGKIKYCYGFIWRYADEEHTI